MRYALTAFAVTLLFLSEHTLIPQLMPDGFLQVYILRPHVTLIGILLVAYYLGSRYGLLYGIVFGLLYDLSTSSVIGISVFVFALVGHITGTVMRLVHRNIWLLLTAVGTSSIFLDLFHYSIFRLFAFTSLDWSFVLLRQVIPSSLMNTFLALLFYPIFHKLLGSIKWDAAEKERRVQT